MRGRSGVRKGEFSRHGIFAEVLSPFRTTHCIGEDGEKRMERKTGVDLGLILYSSIFYTIFSKYVEA